MSFSQSINQQCTGTAHDVRTLLGKHEAVSMAGESMLQQIQALEAIDPQLSRFLLRDGFGEMATNSFIGYRESALIIMGMLIAIGDAGDQLEMYLEAALRNGAIDNEIVDVINLASQYVGAPRAVNAARRIASYLTEARNKRLPGTTETIVHLEDHDTFVWDNHAAGTPIVLIHALSMDHRMWRDVYPQLAGTGRVIAYDLRGHGKARGAPRTESLDHLANDLRLLLDTLGIEKADLYGASYGGAVAQYAALNYPERVRSLGLIATSSQGSIPLLDQRAEAAEQHGMEAQIGVSVIRWFLPETIAENGWAVRYARENVRRARVEDWAAAWRAMARLDVLDRVGQLQQPTLVVAGKQDLSSTPAIMLLTSQAIPNATYELLDPGTHMMVLEQPDTLAEKLVSFRKRVETEAAGS